MLALELPNYKYCPFCGRGLLEEEFDGKIRLFCQGDNWWYFPHVYTSAVAVIQRGDKVLLVQRNREPYKDTWMFPAGFTEFGEYPAETAVREAYEETGYRVSNPILIDIIQVDDDPRAMGQFGFFYKVDLDSGVAEEIADKEENQLIKWFPLDDLPEIGWHSHQHIAKDLQTNNSNL